MVTPFANVANNIASTLAASVTNSDTVIGVAAGAGGTFPAAPFYVSCEFEVMKCVSKTGDSFNVSLGQYGPPATSHTSGTVVELRSNAALFRDLSNAIVAIENGTTLPPAVPVDGSVTDAKVAANAAIQKTKLAGYPFNDLDFNPSIQKGNLLTNGGMEVWQRATTFTSPHGVYTADMWQAQMFTGTHTVSRQSGYNGGYCMLVVFTPAGGDHT